MKQFKRLFTFGCSLTKYKWQTWADILGELAEEFYNHGAPGSGNTQIFNKIMIADGEYNFTSDDTIAICWSGILRDDTYEQGKWFTQSKTEIKQSKLDPIGMKIKTLSYVKAINNFLQNKNIPNIVFSIPLFEDEIPYRNKKIDETFKSELEHLNKVNIFDCLNLNISGADLTKQQEGRRPRPKHNNYLDKFDPHPTPLEHLKIVETALKITINDEIRQKVKQWEKDMWADNWRWTWLDQPRSAWKVTFPDITKNIEDLEKRIKKLENK